MESNWNQRLRESRKKAGIALKEVSSDGALGISQQSIIKYEKGEVVPKVDVLEKMCGLYGVTIDYILYGSSNLPKLDNLSNQLTNLFMLLHSDQICFDQDSDVIKIKNKKLLTHLRVLNYFKNNCDFSSIEDLRKLVSAIRKMEEEKERF